MFKKRRKCIMKLGKQITLGFIGVGLIILLICLGQIVETVKAGTYQTKQAALTGNMDAKMTPGIWFQGFGDIEIWPKAETYFFTYGNDTKGDVDEDTSIEVRFNDGSLCRISGTGRIIMPTNKKQALALITERGHETYRDVQEKLIKPTVRNVLRATANLMSARESYKEKRLDYTNWARDQIEHGVYKTYTIVEPIEDLVTGEKTMREVKKIKTDKDNNPLYEVNPMSGTGIVLKNFEIKVFRYEKKVQEQIAKQQEARMAVETAKAEAEKARQEELKAVAQGKKDVAIAKYQKEQEKIKAVVDAQKEKEVQELDAKRDKNVALISGEKRKEVAKLDRDAAKLKKEEEILLGQGEAERARLKLAADGALSQKLNAVVQMNKDAMDALARRDVPTNYFAAGGGNNEGVGYDTEMKNMMKLVNINMLKALNLDMSIKGKK
jgi:regulator of protease activity HflC (stomatin/prohibitin superfamily)